MQEGNGARLQQSVCFTSRSRKTPTFTRMKPSKKIEGILDKNHVSHGHVDTVCGAWNLNRDWIETGGIDCIVEFCGVYPVSWDMDDVAELERMETDGEIIVLVDWIEDGKHIPNH